MDEWIWNATLDVAGISTFMAILLLIATCTKSHVPVTTDAKKSAYNKVEDVSHSALPEEPPKPPLKPTIPALLPTARPNNIVKPLLLPEIPPF